MSLVCLTPAARAEPFDAVATYDQPLVARVVGAAFGFMRPRTIEPVPLATLSGWGLRSLTTLDPKLQLTLAPDAVRLAVLTTEGVRPVWQRVPATPPEGTPPVSALPGSNDANAWGALVADGLHGGWNASNAVRDAGTTGVLRGFFDELFSHLDPYSRYATPAEEAEARRQRDGEGELGLAIAARPGGLRITGVTPDGPAARAGIRRGGWITAVDDTPVADTADSETATGLLAGPIGSTVTLRVGPTPAGAGRTLTLERVGHMEQTVFARRGGGMLIVRVTGFARDTGSRLAEEIARALPPAALRGRRGIRGVLLDLRGNRGGLLDQAAIGASAFLDDGLVATAEGRDPDSDQTLAVSNGHDAARGLPLVVLVDGRTASAAEVLAGALVDQRRAVAVGSATFGKGLVQTIDPLPDGGALYVSWSRIVAPAGWPLQSLGVLPALCTSAGRDAALDALSELSRGVQPNAGAIARHDAARAPLTLAAALEIRASCPPADGSDLDLAMAARLIDDPKAYATALRP